MARSNVALFGFNHGEISRHALGRVDVDRLRLAAERQANWMPLALGPMMLRPGTGYLGSTKSDAAAQLIPFVFANDDTALLEITNLVMRVWVSDAVLTAVSVSTVITNGDFNSAVGWTLSTSGGGVATIASGVLTLNEVPLGSGASCTRSVSVSVADQAKIHRARINVGSGPVKFRVGTTSGGAEILSDALLESGIHSIAFTPNVTTIHVTFGIDGKISRVVHEITIEAAGAVEIPVPWTSADLSLIRYAQSGDIIYVVCDGYQPRQIERRDNSSWSVVLYKQIGGPYEAKSTLELATAMDPNQGPGGTRTIASSRAYFTSDDLESLIKITGSGIAFSEDISAAGMYSESFEVNGVTSTDRTITWNLGGVWVATVVLQRSITGPDTGFVTVDTQTVNGAYTHDDSATYANITAWYRVGATSVTSGTITVTMTASAGGGSGQARIVAIGSTIEAAVEILDLFEQAGSSLDWRPGAWSARFGWPSSIAFFDGRLFFGGRDHVWGSVSDDFVDFDETDVTDAGPISRSFGQGTFDSVNWLLPLQRLIAGRGSSCMSIRSSSFDAPLTPTDYTAKACAGGAANLAPVAVGSRGIYVDKSGRRVYELAYSVDVGDYKARDLTRLNFDIGDEGFVDIAVQFQPDVRVYLVRGDGVCAVLTYDEDDEVEAWWRIETDGLIESVAVLPGDIEDSVYFVVKRTINGVTKRYLEKMARMDECIGAATNKLADSFLVISQASSTTITGLSHLEAESVTVWGNSKSLGSYTVSGGQITGVSEAVTSAIVGLPYTAEFQSAKLPYAALKGSALTQKKKISQIGLILVDTHYQGLQFGQSLTEMNNLPLVVEGATVAANTIWEAFDAPMISLPGHWQTDARLCLKATAPLPATVNSVVIGIDTHEKP